MTSENPNPNPKEYQKAGPVAWVVLILVYFGILTIILWGVLDLILPVYFPK